MAILDTCRHFCCVELRPIHVVLLSISIVTFGYYGLGLGLSYISHSLLVIPYHSMEMLEGIMAHWINGFVAFLALAGGILFICGVTHLIKTSWNRSKLATQSPVLTPSGGELVVIQVANLDPNIKVPQYEPLTV